MYKISNVSTQSPELIHVEAVRITEPDMMCVSHLNLRDKKNE